MTISPLALAADPVRVFLIRWRKIYGKAYLRWIDSTTPLCARPALLRSVCLRRRGKRVTLVRQAARCDHRRPPRVTLRQPRTSPMRHMPPIGESAAC